MDDFLPDKVKKPQLSKDWDYDKSITECKNLFQEVRKGGIVFVKKMFDAHENLVSKKIKGKTWTGFCEEIGIDRHTPYNWFNKLGWEYTRTDPAVESRNGKTLPLDKPQELLTKPEIKEKIVDIGQEIKQGNVSTDDVKILMDSGAEAIKKGSVKPRAGTKIVRETKKALQKGGKKKRKKANLERLKEHVLAAAEGLTFLADGTIKIETEDDYENVKIIREAAPTFITQYARLGIDIAESYEFSAEKPMKEVPYEGTGSKERTIDITPR